MGNVKIMPIVCPKCHKIEGHDGARACMSCGHVLTIDEMAADVEATSKALLRKPDVEIRDMICATCDCQIVVVKGVHLCMNCGSILDDDDIQQRLIEFSRSDEQ